MPQDSAAANPDPLVSFGQASAIVAEVARRILDQNPPLAEECALEVSLGRVLAADLVADRDQPPFDRATRDGFALRAADVAAGLSLRVIAQIRAGESWPPGRLAVQPGEAVEIMTGAPMPPGADAVLMVEHAQETSPPSESSFQWRIRPEPKRTVVAGENVVPRGSEARRGEVLIAPGTRLGPEEIALAASCGWTQVRVYQRPQVAVLATGDELVEAGAPDGPAEAIPNHRIYDSNSHSLAALLLQSHAVPLRQPAAPDRREELTARIAHAMETAPLLLLTGGVSMGKYDLVEEALAGMGAEFFFTGVKMQPGKPVVFGRVPAADGRPERYFFGLPGNPVSTMVTFRVFVEPLLAAMGGQRAWQPRFALAQLAGEVRVKPGLTRFLPARLDTARDTPRVTPVPTQGSGDLAANARANCYILVPDGPEAAELASQRVVRVLLR